ncbi:MAG: hypothetical protein RLZZ416_397 [Candidatus Parcubacteria bacterium]
MPRHRNLPTTATVVFSRDGLGKELISVVIGAWVQPEFSATITYGQIDALEDEVQKCKLLRDFSVCRSNDGSIRVSARVCAAGQGRTLDLAAIKLDTLFQKHLLTKASKQVLATQSLVEQVLRC